MIKAVIFDIGGVLAGYRSSAARKKRDPSHGVHYFMAKKLRIDLDSWFDAINDIHAGSNVGEFSKAEILRVIAKNIGVPKSRIEKLFSKAYKRHFKRNKKLYAFAFRLRKKGYKIAILSDQWPISKEFTVDKDVKKKFDAVVVSCDVGSRKPGLKVYRMVLKMLKVRPGDSVFIDNRDYNLKPARKLGMKVVLHVSNKQTFKALKRLGVEI